VAANTGVLVVLRRLPAFHVGLYRALAIFPQPFLN
jgi:hypothetical protein